MSKFERPTDADERIENAIAAIEALLPLGIQNRMKRKFLSNCLWQITQAEGKTKYDIRYRSKAAKDASPKGLRHDHVTRRKLMVDALLEHPDRAREIALGAGGCVVTKKEHKLLGKLHKSLDGWERYRQAGIDVVDMVTGEPFEFPVD